MDIIFWIENGVLSNCGCHLEFVEVRGNSCSPNIFSSLVYSIYARGLGRMIRYILAISDNPGKCLRARPIDDGYTASYKYTIHKHIHINSDTRIA